MEWSCPICRDAEDDIAYTMPCHHQFCLGCILRWAHRKLTCPLCRQPIKSIMHSVKSEEDFLEMSLPDTTNPSGAVDEQESGELEPRNYVDGFWASLFQDSVELLEPVLTWLEETLNHIPWWELSLTQGRVISNLCQYGLSEEALIQDLQPFLQEQTVAFVRQLINIAADRCNDLLLRRMFSLGSHAAEEQRNSADTLAPTTFQGETPAPNPSRQEQLSHEEPAQGVSELSTSGQGRDRPRKVCRHPSKRKARHCQTSSVCKRPRHGQH